MQSNKQLKLGLMTNKELAEWFGITNTSFSHNKENKLKQLKQFAKYQLRGNKIKKVYIIEIYDPIYKPIPKSRQIVENQFFKVWNFDGIDTCKRVAGEIYRGNKQELDIKEKTTYQYVLDFRNKGWGSFMKKKNSFGQYGECRLVWGKLVDEDHVECFTQEEQVIKEQLMKKYFGDASEKQIIVKGMVKSGEISKEQAWDTLQSLTLMDWKLPAFLSELSLKVGGYPIVKGTQLLSSSWGQQVIEEKRKELQG